MVVGTTLLVFRPSMDTPDPSQAERFWDSPVFRSPSSRTFRRYVPNSHLINWGQTPSPTIIKTRAPIDSYPIRRWSEREERFHSISLRGNSPRRGTFSGSSSAYISSHTETMDVLAQQFLTTRGRVLHSRICFWTLFSSHKMTMWN